MENCDHWKKNPAKPDDLLVRDIYDGNIWREFLDVLTMSTMIGLMLNVDWFQPFEHTCYSVGVLYLTIINLPSRLRYKRCNILIIGIIPGPSERAHDINFYLQPLVNELLVFWKGLLMKVRHGPSIMSENVRCVLLCCTCDTPTWRKVCGFLGHTARLGCFKCLKQFKGSIGAMNFSGFDRSAWQPRDITTHRENVKKIQQCSTKTARAIEESRLGCRYSVLLKLPYFNPIRMLAIDTMHNLFLGTAKHMLKFWNHSDLVKRSDYVSLQKTVDAIVVSSDVGRIPRKIETWFSSFTADQFKNWVTLFSIPSLHGILDEEHLECWRHFVLARRLLCKNSLSKTDIILADALIMKFCNRVQRLYGEAAITPNMHLNGHLQEVLSDFEPVQEYWLFSFERYNGLLGNQPTNYGSIEPQLMKGFLLNNFAHSFTFPSEFNNDFNSLCNFDQQPIRGTALEVLSILSNDIYSLPTRSTRGTLNPGDQNFVTLLFQRLHPQTKNMLVNSVFTKYSSLEIKGKRYNANQASISMIKWDQTLFQQQTNIMEKALQIHPDFDCRPARV